jgi:hypothetical protein
MPIVGWACSVFIIHWWSAKVLFGHGRRFCFNIIYKFKIKLSITLPTDHSSCCTTLPTDQCQTFRRAIKLLYYPTHGSMSNLQTCHQVAVLPYPTDQWQLCGRTKPWSCNFIVKGIGRIISNGISISDSGSRSIKSNSGSRSIKSNSGSRSIKSNSGGRSINSNSGSRSRISRSSHSARSCRIEFSQLDTFLRHLLFLPKLPLISDELIKFLSKREFRLCEEKYPSGRR